MTTKINKGCINCRHLYANYNMPPCNECWIDEEDTTYPKWEPNRITSYEIRIAELEQALNDANDILEVWDCEGTVQGNGEIELWNIIRRPLDLDPIQPSSSQTQDGQVIDHATE